VADDFAKTMPLGDMVEEVTVGHVGPMVNEYRPAGVPFLRSTNIQPYRLDTSDLVYISHAFHARLRKSTLRPGDLVVVRTGKPGTACVIPASFGEANCSDLVVIRPGDRADSRFLAYFINGMASGHVEAYAVGAVQQHFNIGEAKRLPVPALSLDEQRAIAEVLGALDDKIELNHRTNHTLEEMAAALYKSWFVDFEPVIAKAEGRQPFGMDAATAEFFPSALAVDGPVGWAPVSLSTLMAGTKGRSYTSAELSDNSTTALVSLKSFHRGGGYRRDGLKGYSGPYKPEQEVFPGVRCSRLAS
jgi:type I restriction enzyme S subunit